MISQPEKPQGTCVGQPKPSVFEAAVSEGGSPWLAFEFIALHLLMYTYVGIHVQTYTHT